MLKYSNKEILNHGKNVIEQYLILNKYIACHETHGKESTLGLFKPASLGTLVKQ